jgi:prepilin-type processing-associated H-X9-DG protein
MDYTGPQEQFWAPYDNRPGTSPTKALGDDNFDHGPLWPLVEQSMKAFQCPLGFDQTGQPYQVSYAMNFVTDGPSGQALNVIANNNGTGNVLMVWDHNNGPICAVFSWPRTPCTPFVDANSVHYPYRHGSRFNMLYCDGHVVSMGQNEIQGPLFVGLK